MTLWRRGAFVAGAFWAVAAWAQTHAKEAPPEALTLEEALETGLSQSRLMGEAEALARAAEARVGASGRWPDPELRYEQWSLPLSRPWDLSQAQMFMLGLSQGIPAPGLLPAQREAAARAAEVSESQARARALELAAQVKQAFAAYEEANALLNLLREEQALAEELAALARGLYGAGQRPAAETLRLGLEARRLDVEIVQAFQERASSAALLNTLMGRDPQTLLGAPVPTKRRAPPALDALRGEEAKRPELAAALGALEREEALLEEEQARRRWPSFMVGLDLVYEPMVEKTGYSLMVGMSLPWLNPGREAALDAAREESLARARQVEATRLALGYELSEAAARAHAAWRALRIFDEGLVAEAQGVFDATRLAFTSGAASSLELLDARRALLQLRRERVRAAADFDRARADLERAVGLDLQRLQSPDPSSADSDEPPSERSSQ